jgi:hypothetical protein
MADHFSQPQKLIYRAHRALDACNGIGDAFFTSDNFVEVIEENRETGEKRQKLVQTSPIPDEFEEHITNALNNLRNAFDQMLFAACKAIGKPLRDSHYPWSRDLDDLNDWRLRNKKTGKETIPSEFWDVIRSQQPYYAGEGYEGGYTAMRAVAALANGKHTIGLKISAMVATVRVASTTFQGPGFFAVPLMPVWDSSRNEIEIMRWMGTQPQPHDKHHVELSIVFDETAPPQLHSGIVTHTVRSFGTFAQYCLNGFKERVTDLGF